MHQASGMKRRQQFEKEEQGVINANAGKTSDPQGSTTATGEASSSTGRDLDESDPVLTLHIEQFSIIFDVQIALSKRVRQWDFKIQTFTEEMSMCKDPQRRAAMIMDLQVGTCTKDIYNIFYNRYVGGRPDSVQTFFQNTPNLRLDLDGEFPFYGVDEHGNYADPLAEASLMSWAENNRKKVPRQCIWGTYRGALFVKKVLQDCFACGLNRDDLVAQFGNVQTDKNLLQGDDERAKLKARSKALSDLERQSEYARRFYKGTFDCNAHSYFRPDFTDAENILYIPPDEIILAARENVRRIAATYMVDAHGLALPDKILSAYCREIEISRRSGNFFPLWGIHLHQDHMHAISEAPHHQPGEYRIHF